MRGVTISATYGAGGSVVGPAVAERLGVPFVDRAIPVAVANSLGITVDEALSRDEQVKGWLGRLLASTAPMSAEWMVIDEHPRSALLTDSEVRRCTEGVIREAVRGEGGVILGRAAAIVLRDRPRTFHVRLDGDPERRVAQAMAASGISRQAARDALTRNDRARSAYVRHYYAADAAGCQHYHLVLDSTRVPLETCVDIIVAAAESSDPD